MVSNQVLDPTSVFPTYRPISHKTDRLGPTTERIAPLARSGRLLHQIKPKPLVARVPQQAALRGSCPILDVDEDTGLDPASLGLRHVERGGRGPRSQRPHAGEE